MMRFFWTILLPLSAIGACAALLLWLTRPLLHRMGRMQWPAGAVLAAFCLFVVPAYLLFPGLPGQDVLADALSSVQDPSNSAADLALAPSFSAQASPFSAAAGDLLENLPADTAKKQHPALAEPGSLMMKHPFFVQILPILWAAGMVAALCCSAISYLRFAGRLRRSSRAVTDAAALAGLRAAQEKNGIKRMPGLRSTEAITSPLAMGILHPCIYLPAGIPAGDSLNYALRHECVHLRKRHLFWKMAAQGICAMHWFNPAVWLLGGLLNEACEFDCDRAVAAALEGRQRKDYCTALLDAAGRGWAPRCVSAFACPTAVLRKRIEAVLVPKPRLCRRVAAGVLCAALVLCAAGMTACAAEQAAESVALQLPQEPFADSAASSSKPVQSDAGQTDPLSSAPEEERAPIDEDTQPLQTGGAPDETAVEWVWPVPGMVLIATNYSETGHRGVDIVAPRSDRILAVKSGTVTMAGVDPDHWQYGSMVQIDHGNGCESLYAHCSELLVEVGDRVEAGQEIARVGSTGASTGNHCHLELTENGARIDPLSLIPLPSDPRSSEDPAQTERGS